jgi:hypothetical protein
MGKQKTKPKQELEGPAAPVAVKSTPATAIQMTPSQLSARISKAQTDEDLDRAFESTLNYINTLSSVMSDKEYKENRTLLQQIVIARNAQVENGLQPLLADQCIERMSEVLKAPPAAVGVKTEIPLQFQQFGFFQLADLAGMGSVAFGHLPSEQAIYIPEESQAAALDALNKLANAHFAGGDTAKAGKEYLKFVEGLANNTWPDNADAQDAMVCSIISAGPGAGCTDAKQALQSGNYADLFTDPANPMAEWNNPDSGNYLAWTSKELTLVLSVNAAKYILKGPRGEFGAEVKGTVHKETTYSVEARGTNLSNREEKSKHLPGGGGGLYGEVGGGRWKVGAKVGAEYVPGEQGGWFIPVEAFGEMTAGTDETSQTIRLQAKASPEATGRALTLEGGVLWNALFFQKGDTAVGYVFGVKAARMSTTNDGTTNVDLVIEGQLGPTFQKIFREKGLVLWTGVAGIVQQEIPQEQTAGVMGPLPQQTKVGGGLQLGLGGEKVEGFIQLQLNPITVIEDAYTFTGRDEQGRFNGVTGVIGIRF